MTVVTSEIDELLTPYDYPPDAPESREEYEHGRVRNIIDNLIYERDKSRRIVEESSPGGLMEFDKAVRLIERGWLSGIGK